MCRRGRLNSASVTLSWNSRHHRVSGRSSTTSSRTRLYWSTSSDVDNSFPRSGPCCADENVLQTPAGSRKTRRPNVPSNFITLPSSQRAQIIVMSMFVSLFTRITQKYLSMLFYANLNSLASRRENFSRVFFLQYHGSCLLSPQSPSSTRSTVITSTLRSSQTFPKVYTRTKRYCSFIQYRLNHYQ